MQEALATLNALIAQGREYPDAHCKAATAHAVECQELQVAYDQQFG